MHQPRHQLCFARNDLQIRFYFLHIGVAYFIGIKWWDFATCHIKAKAYFNIWTIFYKYVFLCAWWINMYMCVWHFVREAAEREKKWIWTITCTDFYSNFSNFPHFFHFFFWIRMFRNVWKLPLIALQMLESLIAIRELCYSYEKLVWPS